MVLMTEKMDAGGKKSSELPTKHGGCGKTYVVEMWNMTISNASAKGPAFATVLPAASWLLTRRIMHAICQRIHLKNAGTSYVLGWRKSTAAQGRRMNPIQPRHPRQRPEATHGFAERKRWPDIRGLPRREVEEIVTRTVYVRGGAFGHAERPLQDRPLLHCSLINSNSVAITAVGGTGHLMHWAYVRSATAVLFCI